MSVFSCCLISPDDDQFLFLLTDIARTMHPSPTGLQNSEGPSRRARRVSGCRLCGDCKYISPQRKTLGVQGQKSSNPGAEQPTAEVKIKKENAATETSKKIIIWIDEYPKLTLCDVAQKCDSSGGFLLPDVLKTKVVHCFKQKKRVCRSQSPTEHQRQLNERTDVQTLSSCSAASFLLGEGTNKECRTGRDVDEDPGILNGAGTHRNKRIKLVDSVKDRIMPSTPDLESASCKDAAKTDSRDQDEPCLWMSEASQACLEVAAVKENCLNPTKTDAAQELFCQSDEVDMDEPESFTCQRVRAYFRKIKFSCARTYMSWPLSGWPRKAPTARDRSASPLNQNHPSNDTSPDAPTGASSAQQVSHRNEEKQKEDGEHILAERNGKRHSNTSSPSMETEESLASLPSDTLSNPSQRGRESGTDSSSGAKADSSTSTPSPSALGLTDWESATTVSPMSSPFTHGSLSSLSATPSSLPASSFPLKKVDGDAHSASASLTSPKRGVRAVEKTLFCCEEITSWTPHDSDSLESSASSLLLPQESKEGPLTDRSPPKLEPYYKTSPFNNDLAVVKERSLHKVLSEKCVDSNEFVLPPMLSPVTSPQERSGKSVQSQNQACSDEEEEEEENKDTSKHKILPQMPQINVNNENSKDYLEHGGEIFKGTRFKTTSGEHHSPRDDDDNEEESQDQPDYEDDVEQGNKTSVPSDLQIKETSGALTEPCSPPSSDEDDDQGKPRSSSEEGSGSERDDAGDTQLSVLDEFTAYKQDILLVDVIQDDQELFGNVPQESLLKLGPCRVTGTPKTRPVKIRWAKTDGASLENKQRYTLIFESISLQAQILCVVCNK